MLRKGRVLVAVAALALVACDKKNDAPPPPSGGIPPLDDKALAAPIGEKPVHEPTGAAAANPHAGMNLPAGHPAVGGDAPSGMTGQTTPGDIAFDPKTVVSGVIQVDTKLKSKVAEGDAIYLVARSADNPGPPLAVKKLTATKFPIEFELDARDAMMAGTKMAGKVTVTARVDKDGDAMTKNPGDVIGTKTVELPAQKVVLTLDSVL